MKTLICDCCKEEVERTGVSQMYCKPCSKKVWKKVAGQDLISPDVSQRNKFLLMPVGKQA